MNQPANKRFDCMEIKRKAQEEIYAETKDMSNAEQLEYFRKAVQDGPFKDRWNASGKKPGERRTTTNK